MRLLQDVDAEKTFNSASAPAQVNVPLINLPTSHKGLPLHLYCLIVEVAMTIRQAASAPALNPEDLYRLFTLIELKKGTKSIMRIAGHQLPAWNAYGNGYVRREPKLPDVIPESVGGGDTSIVFKMPIYFDTPKRRDKKMFVSPVGAFGPSSELRLTIGVPTTQWAATISITGTPTINVRARLVAEEHVLSPVPFEAYQLSDSTTGNFTYSMEAGYFDLIALTPPAFGVGGGDDAPTKYTDIDGSQHFPERLRARAGTQYRDAAILDLADESDNTLVYEGKMLPLVGPTADGAPEQHLLVNDKEWKLKTTIGTALSGNQSMLCVEFKNRCAGDEAKVYQEHGYDPERGSLVTAAKCLPPERSSIVLHPMLWRPGKHEDGSRPDETPGNAKPGAILPNQC